MRPQPIGSRTTRVAPRKDSGSTYLWPTLTPQCRQAEPQCHPLGRQNGDAISGAHGGPDREPVGDRLEGAADPAPVVEDDDTAAGDQPREAHDGRGRGTDRATRSSGEVDPRCPGPYGPAGGRNGWTTTGRGVRGHTQEAARLSTARRLGLGGAPRPPVDAVRDPSAAVSRHGLDAG